MKAWSIAVLLIAAVLAEKALARPSAGEDEEDFQEDGPANDEDGDDGVRSGPVAQPKLLSNAEVFVVKPGDTVWLPCTVENANTVAWLNKTANLAINKLRFTYKEDTRITIHDNHTLEIRNAQPTDAGDYTCKLSDSLRVQHELSFFGKGGNGAPITRISFSLLLGAVVLLFTRS